MSFRLLNEFRNLHFRTFDGALIVRTLDQNLLNELKNFILQKTGLPATVQEYQGTPQIKYDNFDMRDWYEIYNELKHHNLGNIKTGMLEFSGAHFDSHAIQNDEYTIPYNEVGRVFANPEENMLRIVTKYDHMSFNIRNIKQDTMQAYMKAIKKFLPDAYPYVANVFVKKNEKVEQEVAKVVQGGGFYKLKLEEDSQLIIRTERQLEDVEKICRVVYGDNFIQALPMKDLFVDFDEIVKEHNRKVAIKMKELESLRIL